MDEKKPFHRETIESQSGVQERGEPPTYGAVRISRTLWLSKARDTDTKPQQVLPLFASLTCHLHHDYPGDLRHIHTHHFLQTNETNDR